MLVICIPVIVGIYWGYGKENGWDNGKENGSYYSIQGEWVVISIRVLNKTPEMHIAYSAYTLHLPHWGLSTCY